MHVGKSGPITTSIGRSVVRPRRRPTASRGPAGARVPTARNAPAWMRLALKRLPTMRSSRRLSSATTPSSAVRSLVVGGGRGAGRPSPLGSCATGAAGRARRPARAGPGGRRSHPVALAAGGDPDGDADGEERRQREHVAGHVEAHGADGRDEGEGVGVPAYMAAGTAARQPPTTPAARSAPAARARGSTSRCGGSPGTARRGAASRSRWRRRARAASPGCPSRAAHRSRGVTRRRGRADSRSAAR